MLLNLPAATLSSVPAAASQPMRRPLHFIASCARLPTQAGVGEMMFFVVVDEKKAGVVTQG